MCQQVCRSEHLPNVGGSNKEESTPVKRTRTTYIVQKRTTTKNNHETVPLIL